MVHTFGESIKDAYSRHTTFSHLRSKSARQTKPGENACTLCPPTRFAFRLPGGGTPELLTPTDDASRHEHHCSGYGLPVWVCRSYMLLQHCWRAANKPNASFNWTWGLWPVSPDMSSAGLTCRKRFATSILGTVKRLLACMCSHMPSKSRVMRK